MGSLSLLKASTFIDQNYLQALLLSALITTFIASKLLNPPFFLVFAYSSLSSLFLSLQISI